jgi:hypothetical protein
MAVVKAQRWKPSILVGEIYCKEQLACEENLNASYVGRILRLVVLGPRWLDATVGRRKITDQRLSKILKRVPLDWGEQKF